MKMVQKYRKAIAVLLFVTLSGFFHSCATGEEEQDGLVVESGEQTESQHKTDDSQEETEKQDSEETKPICVFVTGCVVSPGVYEVSPGTRIYEVLELAGGFTAEADTTFLNLAEYVRDGQKLVIYSLDQTAGMTSVLQDDAQFQTGTQSGAQSISQMVNLNTADKSELMTLPGIGEAKAEAIIRYRTEQGKFSSIEDVMKIPGIKEAAFEKMKHLITV